MIYTFDRYKNISVNARFIMLKSEDENVSYSVGCLRDDETIEQALNRLGIDFDTRYPDYIIQ